MKAGRPAGLQVLVQDVRGVGEEVRHEVASHVGGRELREVLGELRLRVAPREVGVALREAELG